MVMKSTLSRIKGVFVVGKILTMLVIWGRHCPN
jgi:hypothetical protein